MQDDLHLTAERAQEISDATDRAKVRRERELNDLRKVLAMPEGRRLLWRYMSVGRIFHLSFVGGIDGARLTDFNEGRKGMALDILKDVLEAKPAAFEQMRREAAADKKGE